MSHCKPISEQPEASKFCSNDEQALYMRSDISSSAESCWPPKVWVRHVWGGPNGSNSYHFLSGAELLQSYPFRPFPFWASSWFFPREEYRFALLDIFGSTVHKTVCQRAIVVLTICYRQNPNMLMMTNPPALINASPVSMGLLSTRGPPAWHPATQDIK